MKIKSIILCAAFLLTVLFASFSSAVMRANNSIPQKPDYDMATGFFGGITNGRFLLMLTENSGFRYYAAPTFSMFVSDGRSVTSLPRKTPIQIKIRSGKIVDVVVLEAGK